MNYLQGTKWTIWRGGGPGMDYYGGGRRETEYEATNAIQVGVKAGPDAEEARWALIVAIFFRVVSALWMLEGLEQWRRLIAPASGTFLDTSTATASATFFFAIFDLVAAVGLWLVAPWGGVVWMLTLLAQIFVVSVKPGFFWGGGLVKWFDGALLAVYLVLSWRANVAAGEEGPIDRLIESLRASLRALADRHLNRN